MAKVFEYHLKDGRVLDLSEEEFLSQGYTEDQVKEKLPLYEVGDEKLSTNDINNLLDQV